MTEAEREHAATSGADAFARGDGLHTNPYLVGIGAWYAWRDGWNGAAAAGTPPTQAPEPVAEVDYTPFDGA